MESLVKIVAKRGEDPGAILAQARENPKYQGKTVVVYTEAAYKQQEAAYKQQEAAYKQQHPIKSALSKAARAFLSFLASAALSVASPIARRLSNLHERVQVYRAHQRDLKAKDKDRRAQVKAARDSQLTGVTQTRSSQKPVWASIDECAHGRYFNDRCHECRRTNENGYQGLS